MFGETQGVGQHRLEGTPVVGLEDFGIGPIESRVADERLGGLHRPAQALEQEDGVGELAAHEGHDDVPCGLGDHVARVATEAVHAQTAPIEEDVRDFAAEGRLGVVQLHEVRPRDAPGAGRMEGAVHVTLVPLRMVDLEGRGPARVVRGQIHEEAAFVRVGRRHQLAELIERRGRGVELRQRGVHREEVQSREGRAVAAHARIGRRGGMNGQEEQVAEAEPREDVVEVTRQRTEGAARRDDGVARLVQRLLFVREGGGREGRGHDGAELAREGRVDGVVGHRVRGGHLDDGVLTVRPLRDRRVVGDETDLARKDTHLQKRDAHAPFSAPTGLHRDVVPIVAADQSRLIHVRQHLALMHRGRTQIRTENHTSRAPLFAESTNLENIADPAQKMAASRRFLSHHEVPLFMSLVSLDTIIPNNPTPRKS